MIDFTGPKSKPKGKVGLLKPVAIEDSKARTAVVRLLKPVSDDDTRALFERLAREAESGELVGAVVISFGRKGGGGQQFNLALSGLGSTNPTLAAGAVSACQVLIQELALLDSGLI